MRVLAASGAGFLLAVLWFDLMFDVQARGHPDTDVPAEVRASIAAYYARVTTAARPMNRLVAAVMVVTIGALAAELVRGDLPRGRAFVSLIFAMAAVGLAVGRTVPNAVRLGRRIDGAVRQSQLTHTIMRDHLICIAAIAGVLVLQLAPV